MDENNQCNVCKNTFLSNTAFYYHALDCIKINDDNKKDILKNII